MLKLIGSLEVNGKQFSMADSIGKEPLGKYGITDDYYGGNVHGIANTEYGIVMLLDKKDNPINLGYVEEELTDLGKALLAGIPIEEATEEIQEEIENKPMNLEELDRKELRQMAKQLDVEGNIDFMKTLDLIEKVREKIKSQEQ